MHECPWINVLSLETSSCLNVETEPRMKWYGDGETEPMENLHMGNGISASAIMKKSKNGNHFINMHHTEKFQITNLPPLPYQDLVSGFLSVDRNRKLVLGHYEKIKQWLPFHKYASYRKISNYWPLQSLGLWFSECLWKWNISIDHYEKIEKWPPFCKCAFDRTVWIGPKGQFTLSDGESRNRNFSVTCAVNEGSTKSDWIRVRKPAVRDIAFIFAFAMSKCERALRRNQKLFPLLRTYIYLWLNTSKCTSWNI